MYNNKKLIGIVTIARPIPERKNKKDIPKSGKQGQPARQTSHRLRRRQPKAI